MPKDYTDFIIWIFSRKGQLKLSNHRRIGQKTKEYMAKGTPLFCTIGAKKYRFRPEYAFRTRWVGWDRWEEAHRKLWPFLEELFRTKKIGFLFYQEPSSDMDTKLIEPIHLSKIIQPSGELRSDA
jgi:hypothetical protein